MICVIEDCAKRAHSRGWCDMHYRRWRVNGSPLVTRRMGRPRSTFTYDSVHAWLKTERGPARNYDCLRCDSPAKEWAYLGGGVDEQVCKIGRPFSSDLLLYVPMCLSCHRSADNRHRRLVVPPEVHERYASGQSVASLSREYGFHPATLWRHLNESERPKGVLKA